MPTQPAPTLFLSHSHRDKRIARRLVRRLTAHGFKVWLDERELPLVTTVGQSELEPSLIAAAIRLLQECDPPNNHALYKFIGQNATHLDQEQRRSVLRLITWPVREDTSRFADVLGWVAPNHFPDAIEIQQMWGRWIHTGAFDRGRSSPSSLASYFADAHKEQLPGLEPINEALRSHVRKYLRSGDEKKVGIATDHIVAAANADTPILASLLREAEGAAASAEWNDWQKRDADAAERMRWYVYEIVKEAAGDRDWLRAAKSAKQMVGFEKRRRQILADDELKQKDDG